MRTCSKILTKGFTLDQSSDGLKNDRQITGHQLFPAFQPFIVTCCTGTKSILWILAIFRKCSMIPFQMFTVLSNSSPFNWFFKYKLYHIPFWFAYHICWWTINIGSVWQTFNNLIYSPYAIKFLFYVVFQAIGVYFNLYFLIPRFLEKGKYIQYLSFLLATVVLTAAFIVTGYYTSAYLSVQTFSELYRVDPKNYFYFFQVNTLPSTMASMTLAMSLKLSKNWIEARRREQELEKEKLETELKFLKSQINPHFLFNTINSIFVLIHKNPAMASESLAKFSDLLRYQLYECNEQQIPLQQELMYLENFIELQKLRQDEQHIELALDTVQQPYGDLVIAPFILMPFIENAFKHVSQGRNRSNWIRMKMKFQDHRLVLSISNSIQQQFQPTELMRDGGIGLKNVKRRLDLVYPGKHTLKIRKDDDEFSVELSLELQEGKVPELVTA